MQQIHPTAIVASGAKLSSDVVVGPYSVIDENVTIGGGTEIGSHVVIEGHTTLGSMNRVFHHATLGQRPQDLKFSGEVSTLTIGDSNDIRENVTMHVGTTNGGGNTSVGSSNLIMAGAHIAHDSHIGNHCVLANNVLLAGHVLIDDYAVLGGGSAITQYVRVGSYVYIGGLSGVVHDCPPYMVCDGHPAYVRGVNLIGLARHRFDDDTIERLKTAYRMLFKRNDITCEEAVRELTERFSSDSHVVELCRFILKSLNTSNGRYAEASRVDNKRRTQPR